MGDHHIRDQGLELYQNMCNIPRLRRKKCTHNFTWKCIVEYYTPPYRSFDIAAPHMMSENVDYRASHVVLGYANRIVKSVSCNENFEIFVKIFYYR